MGGLGTSRTSMAGTCAQRAHHQGRNRLCSNKRDAAEPASQRVCKPPMRSKGRCEHVRPAKSSQAPEKVPRAPCECQLAGMLFRHCCPKRG